MSSSQKPVLKVTKHSMLVVYSCYSLEFRLCTASAYELFNSYLYVKNMQNCQENAFILTSTFQPPAAVEPSEVHLVSHPVVPPSQTKAEERYVVFFCYLIVVLVSIVISPFFYPLT